MNDARDRELQEFHEEYARAVRILDLLISQRDKGAIGLDDQIRIKGVYVDNMHRSSLALELFIPDDKC